MGMGLPTPINSAEAIPLLKYVLKDSLDLGNLQRLSPDASRWYQVDFSRCPSCFLMCVGGGTFTSLSRCQTQACDLVKVE